MSDAGKKFLETVHVFRRVTIAQLAKSPELRSLCQEI